MGDETGFRVGHSHGDIVYHHVEGRDKNLDPRYAVCQYRSEALMLVQALNEHTEAWTKDYFDARGLRW